MDNNETTNQPIQNITKQIIPNITEPLNLPTQEDLTNTLNSTVQTSTSFISIIPKIYIYIALAVIASIIIIAVICIIYKIIKKRSQESPFEAISNNSVVMNKIVIKNPLSSKNQNYDFHSIQNSSNLSVPSRPNENMSLSEIKEKNIKINLGDEISNIINQSSDGMSGRKKKKKGKGTPRANKSDEKKDKDNVKISKSSDGIKNMIEDKDDDEDNTKKLEKEVKELMKKFYVLDDKNKA